MNVSGCTEHKIVQHAMKKLREKYRNAKICVACKHLARADLWNKETFHQQTNGFEAPYIKSNAAKIFKPFLHKLHTRFIVEPNWLPVNEMRWQNKRYDVIIYVHCENYEQKGYGIIRCCRRISHCENIGVKAAMYNK